MPIKDFKPYIKASSYIIGEVTGLKVEAGEIIQKVSPFFLNDVVVLFGVIGKIKGQTSFSMNNRLAMKISSAMLEYPEVRELDELSKSAIAELGNMIMGHTANEFYKKGIVYDFTPPTILTGDKLCFSVDKMKIANIPLIIDGHGVMEINIAYMTAV